MYRTPDQKKKIRALSGDRGCGASGELTLRQFAASGVP
jgi:hypothetical protein